MAPSMTTIIATPDVKPRSFWLLLGIAGLAACTPPMDASLKFGAIAVTVCFLGALGMYTVDCWLVRRINRDLAAARRHAEDALAAPTLTEEFVAAAIRDALPSPEKIEEGVRTAVEETLRPVREQIALIERSRITTVH